MGKIKPSFAEEKIFEAKGYRRIAGVDEAGRGSLAGPVVAAATIMPCHKKARWFSQVRDSKLLSPPKRELLFDCIQKVALGIGTGIVSHEMIDKDGIIKATRLAMKLAIEQISPLPDAVLIDYMNLPEVHLPQKGVKNGDSLCFSIACASIVAKVTRDHLMIDFDKTYPGYGLAQHKGYGTREHLSCLYRIGLSPIHRRSFQPITHIIQREK